MKQVVGISRRTDIVAFYPQWLKGALEAGEITFRPPRGVFRTVSLRPEDVHTLVFWSKNYLPLLRDKHLQDLITRYDSVYFHFSITGLGGTQAERRVLPTLNALRQARELAELWEPERINWRFDPIVHWLDDQGNVASNARMFTDIARGVSEAGIKTCTFSFAQWYGKIPARATKWGFRWTDPDDEFKLSELLGIIDAANHLGISLYSCAQEKWAGVPGVNKSSCIDGDLLTSLHPNGAEAPTGKDQGQRTECGCTISVDIGSYSQACPHGCVYCYATPVLSKVTKGAPAVPTNG